MHVPKWTPKPRQWANGRRYWIVSKGSISLLGENGDESRFDGREVAQHHCDELNAADALSAREAGNE